MESNASEQNVIPNLVDLAEFRFQLRKFLSFSEVASEAQGIAAQQYQLMQVIGALPAGQNASISYLAERMILRHNSTVELVDRAERAGLVQRRDDEKDLRRSLVELTPNGRTILTTLVAQHIDELTKRAPSLLFTLHQVTGVQDDGSQSPTPQA